jgi:ABC-type oligopeptide transport system substrate-binding subunit
LQEFIAGLGPAYAEARRTGSFDYRKPTGAITVLDDHTFRLNLLKPYPQILYWLAMPFTAPVPREAIEYYNGKNGREQFKFHPVGTGPYRMAEWARGRLIRLARNEHYTATRFPLGAWSTLADKPLPFLDEVQLAIIRESVPAWLLFRQGYLDRSGISKDVFNSVITTGLTLSEKYQQRGVHLYRDVEPGTFYLVFNMEDPLVGKNLKLRQAIATAYDETRANAIFQNGIAVKAEQLLPPGVTGHDPQFVNPFRTEKIETAQRLLAEAGYPGGIDPKTGHPLELTLDVIASDSASRQFAEFQKTQIEQLGLRCKIEENNWARFQDKQDRGHFQINGGSGWNADYPDPENFFFLFYSKNIPPQGSNYARYTNPEFDRLFEQIATMPNSPERLALLRQMNEILTRDCPIVLLFHPVAFSLNQPWIPRIASNPMVAGGLKYATLDPQLREQKRREWNQTPLWPSIALGGLLLIGVGSAIVLGRRQNV